MSPSAPGVRLTGLATPRGCCGYVRTSPASARRGLRTGRIKVRQSCPIHAGSQPCHHVRSSLRPLRPWGGEGQVFPTGGKARRSGFRKELDSQAPFCSRRNFGSGFGHCSVAAKFSIWRRTGDVSLVFNARTTHSLAKPTAEVGGKKGEGLMTIFRIRGVGKIRSMIP